MLVAVPGEVEHTVETKVESVQLKLLQNHFSTLGKQTLDRPQNSIVPLDHDVYPSPLSTP